MDENIKKAKAYKDTLDEINKTIETQTTRFGILASEVGIAFSAWNSQTKKTQADRLEEIRLIDKATTSVKSQTAIVQGLISKELELDKAFKKNKSSAELFSDTLSSLNASDLANQFSSIGDIQKKIYELEKNKKDLSQEQLDDLEKFNSISKKYQEESNDFHTKNEKNFKEWLDNNTKVQDIFENLPVPLNTISEKMEYIKTLQERGADEAERLVAAGIITGKVATEVLDETNKLVESRIHLSNLQAESANQLKTETNLLKRIGNVAKDNAENAFKGIYDSMKATNQALNDAQKDFGMSFDGAYTQMAGLTSEAARFGMSTKDTVDMMGQLGDELKTTDTKYLASATEHFVAIQKATGISSEEVTTIAGEMMRAGKSAEQVEGFMDSSNKIAKKFGVNTKKVLQGVSKNIDKMRQMGFQGGEESLTRMAARAERLNMNMDEMFDVAKKARNIEGAMEMAADLQLAGGSFANINPMDLLAAARKGPEELQKILTQMGGDIGDFDKKTGELKFDAIDADRLQMVADATGQTVDSIQKGLQKAAADNAKLDVLGLDSSIGEDAKNFLSDMTTMKDGQLSVSPELSDLASGAGIDISNVDDLKNLSQEDTKKLMAAKADKEKSLEEQALANQSFQESMTAFKDSVMSLFTIFQPVLDVFTSFVQGILSMGPWAQGLAAAIVGLVAFGPRMVLGFQSFRDSAKSVVDGFKGFASGFKEGGIKGALKGAFGKKDDIATNANTAGSTQAPGKSGGGLQSLAEGLKAMGDPKVFAGIGALALAAPVLVLFIPAAILALPALALAGMMHDQIIQGFEALALGLSAMGEKGILSGIAALAIAVVPLLLFIPAAILALPAMAVAGLLDKLIVRGFSALADGLAYVGSNLTGVLKGSLALAVAGASLIPFAFSAQMLSDVNWLSVLAGIGILALVVLGLVGLGALLMTPAGLFLAIGVFALVGVGAALMVFGAAVAVFAAASQTIQGMSFDWLGSLGWNLLIASPGLLLGGLALMVAAPALMFGSMGLLALGVAAQALSGIDWTAFAAIGDALSSIVPGLLGFSLAGLMFVNPITLLGMLLMIGNLGMLAAIMAPLALSLNSGADGLDRFSDGLAKLQAAASSLDFERLEALKELSVGMAGGGSGGMGAEIQKIAEALAALTKTAGGGSGGGNKKIEINLKLNGRDLQNIIVDDTSIVS